MKETDIIGQCDRCEVTFKAKEGYQMVESIDRPHDDDLAAGNFWDNSYVICGYCSAELFLWMRPNYFEELFGMNSE